MPEGDSKRKKKGHRPKKFENPSTVISFRADKEKYKQHKELFRERIETTIKQVTEEINNKKEKKQEGRITQYFNKNKEIPKKQSIKRKITPPPKSSRDFTRTEFDLDGNLQEYPNSKQNNTSKQLEKEQLDTFYHENQKEIKDKVKQFIEEQEQQEQEKDLTREEIFEEFEEEIDVELDEFKER
ncbi:MAG: hypothetical protein ACFFCE_01760 [Promethearchaeota archaeon]